jgi:hypothetical protein
VGIITHPTKNKRVKCYKKTITSRPKVVWQHADSFTTCRKFRFRTGNKMTKIRDVVFEARGLGLEAMFYGLGLGTHGLGTYGHGFGTVLKIRSN